MSNRREEFRNNHAFREYLKWGGKAATALESLDQLMTNIISQISNRPKSDANTSGPLREDKTEKWLEQELIRFLERRAPAIDPENELAVVAMAVRGYQYLKTDPDAQDFIKCMARITENEDKKRTPENVTRVMYRLIGRYSRDTNQNLYPHRELRLVKRTSDLRELAVIVEEEVGLNQLEFHDDVDATFTETVRFCRSKLPYGRPEQVFALAKRLYFSADRTLFDEVDLMEDASKILLVPDVSSTGAKQNPLNKSKLSGGKPKDPLKRVKEIVKTKNRSRKERLTPVMNGIDPMMRLQSSVVQTVAA